MLRKILPGMANLRYESKDPERAAKLHAQNEIISEPWIIAKANPTCLNKTLLQIVSNDRSTEICKILLSEESLVVVFRNLKKHKAIIDQTKFNNPNHWGMPDDILNNTSSTDSSNALFISVKSRNKQLSDRAQDVVQFFNLLIQIENDVLSALASVCHVLGEHSNMADEVLSFFEVYELLNKEAYSLCDQITLTNQSFEYLIDQLKQRADDDKNGKISEILTAVANLCAEIPPTHRYYPEANQLLLDLSFRDEFTEAGDLEKISRLENRLRFALRAENQVLTDLTYHELCQEPGIGPNLKNIQGDEDTLIQLAAQIRQKNVLIAQLNSAVIQHKDATRSNPPSPRLFGRQM